MKKYKLIKEYPESSPKGTVFVAHNEINAIFQAEGSGTVIYYNTIEKYSEYFEEVKEEPNYLITAFKRVNSFFKLSKDGRYYPSDGMPVSWNLKTFIDEKFEIYSVKNSKGEEFTIGDKINASTLKNATIKSFAIINKSMIVYCDIKTNFLDIEWCSKVRTPIYTTTDGVDIYEGDRVWLSLLHKDLSKHENDLVLVGNFSQKDKEVADRYLTFTSEENRDKYIKENQRKPIFVSADNVEIFDYDYNLFSIYPRDTWTEKRCRVKQAIEFENWLHFHTKEARQEYIDNNKPKYSLADIEKAINGLIIIHAAVSKHNILESLKKLGK